jgi:hypothetical protein
MPAVVDQKPTILHPKLINNRGKENFSIVLSVRFLNTMMNTIINWKKCIRIKMFTFDVPDVKTVHVEYEQLHIILPGSKSQFPNWAFGMG